MRVAVLLGRFPSISQTFILRQITALIDLGHEVDIYAQDAPADGGSVHPEIARYGLLARTVYTDTAMPRASGYWELPVRPIAGRTRLPDSDATVRNAVRIARAIPAFARASRVAPRVALAVLRRREFGHEAESLSALYRASVLARRRRRYDVLHAHFGPIANTFRFARALWSAPLVVSFHGYDYSTWPRRKGPDVYARLFHTLDVATVNSEHARGRLEALGCPPGAIRKLAYGLGLAEFPFRERSRRGTDPVRILTVARLVAKKGVEDTIRAVAAVRKRHPDLRHDIVGDGPLQSTIERLIHDLGLEGAVVLHGARDGAYVRRLMADAHLFVLASVTAPNGDQEGTPVSLLEAQASGLPVLSTMHAGIPEIVVDGESGFLVPEGDIDALTVKLHDLVERPAAWPAMGRRGRRRIEDAHDGRAVTGQLVDVYADAIRRHRGP